MEIAYFKREQKYGIHHYYKVYGGPGKIRNGYQEVINFLNDMPIISIEHNLPSAGANDKEEFQLTGTWCQYEVGIPISETEYLNAYREAVQDEFDIR